MPEISRWSRFRAWLSGHEFARFLGGAVVITVVGWVVTQILQAALQNSTAKDVGIDVIAVLGLGLVGVLALRFVGGPVVIQRNPQASAPAARISDGGMWSAEFVARLSTVTGDTRVSDVIQEGVHPDMWGVEEQLKLSEVALLRRLDQIRKPRERTALRSSCEELLAAGQTAHPTQVLGELVRKGFLTESMGLCTLTGEGQRVGYRFLRHLGCDPFLVAAYRTVTARMNRQIMLDGRPLET